MHITKKKRNDLSWKILNPSGGSTFAALGELKETLEAIPAGRIRKLSVTVTQAVAVGRHYASCFTEDREDIDKAVRRGGFDVEAHDDMAKRAQALWEANVLFLKLKNGKGGATKLARQAREMKVRLKKTAYYLWSEDKKKMKTLSAMKRGNSRFNLANDVFKLYRLFIENMDEVKRRSDITEVDIARVDELGKSLLDAVGPSGDERLRAAKDLRARAGDYLRQGIDNIRAAAGFVFQWDEKHISRYPKLGELRTRNNKRQSKSGAEGSQNLKLVK
jgi:hypothetical protein